MRDISEKNDVWKISATKTHHTHFVIRIGSHGSTCSTAWDPSVESHGQVGYPQLGSFPWMEFAVVLLWNAEPKGWKGIIFNMFFLLKENSLGNLGQGMASSWSKWWKTSRDYCGKSGSRGLLSLCCKRPSLRSFLGILTIVTTLPETNIAPENDPLEKEIPIGNHHFQVPC